MGVTGTPSAAFRLGSQDHDWVELTAGLSYTTDRVAVSFGADTTALRRDVRNQAFHGAVTIKF